MKKYLKPNVILYVYAQTDMITDSVQGDNDSNGDGGNWSAVIPIE